MDNQSGGKFTERNNKRTAYNNFVSQMCKNGVKDLKQIGKLWQKEKLISKERTVKQILNTEDGITTKLKDKEISDYLQRVKGFYG